MKNTKVCVITPNAFMNDSRALKQLYSLKNSGFQLTAVEFFKSKKDVLPAGLEIIMPKEIVTYEIKPAASINDKKWAVKLKNKIYSMKNLINFHYVLCYRELLRILPKSDIYIMHSPFPFLALYKISRNEKVDIVYDAHEFYMGQEFLDKKSFQKKIYDYLLSKLEFFSVQYSKITLTVSSGIADLLKEKYKADPVIIMNTHDERINIKSERWNVRRFFDNDDFLILMIGNGRNGLDVNYLIEETASLNRRFKLVLVGKNHRTFIREDLIKFENEKFFVFDDVNAAEIVSFVEGCNVGIIFLDSLIPNFKFSLPNKIFQYMHAGIPILYNELIELNKIFNKFAVGEMFDRNSHRSLRNIIINLSASPKKIEEYKKACAEASKIYNWENEEKNFLHIINKLASKRS